MPRTGDRQESTSAVGENDGSHSRGVFAPVEIAEAAADVRRPVRIVRHRTSGRVGIEVGGIGPADPSVDPADGLERVGSLPPLYPEWLGDRTFNAVHGIRFPYIAGAMANGISSQQFVVEAARADILGVFGAAGLDLDQIERGLASIDRQLDRDEDAWAANIIRSPHGSDFESELVDRLLDRGVETATASGFVEVTRPVVRYACSGLHTDGEGRIRRSNRLIAKVSRAEVARRFAAPASGDLLDDLVDSGDLTRREASLAREVPLAEDITAEADSGGHTDGRPLPVVVPEIRRAVADVAAEHGYDRPLRVGAAGGLGTPAAVASALALGADYVVTGSVNQATVESGLSDAGKRLLAEADPAETETAPSADRFEQGADVQVLGRGTMFAQRANRLGRLYRRYDSLEDLPAEQIEFLEEELFDAPLGEVREQTRAYWKDRAPEVADRARRDGRREMALVFRRYLGRSSSWAFEGAPDRRADYQIWCGPAMGAFNRWVEGSFLEDLSERTVGQIARNLLEGAAVATRGQQLRNYGVPVPARAFEFEPRPLEA